MTIYKVWQDDFQRFLGLVMVRVDCWMNNKSQIVVISPKSTSVVLAGKVGDFLAWLIPNFHQYDLQKL